MTNTYIEFLKENDYEHDHNLTLKDKLTNLFSRELPYEKLDLIRFEKFCRIHQRETDPEHDWTKYQSKWGYLKVLFNLTIATSAGSTAMLAAATASPNLEAPEGSLFGAMLGTGVAIGSFFGKRHYKQKFEEERLTFLESAIHKYEYLEKNERLPHQQIE